jgi:hypothetical protein
MSEEFEVLSIHVLPSLKLLCKSETVHRLGGRSHNDTMVMV